MRKIVANLSGGIGNQLFQYYAVREISKKLNCEFILDHSYSDLSHHEISYDSRIFSEIKMFSRSGMLVRIKRSKIYKYIRLRTLGIIRQYGFWDLYKIIFGIINDFENINPEEIDKNEILSMFSAFLGKRLKVRSECYFPNFNYFWSLNSEERKLTIANPSNWYSNMSAKIKPQDIIVHLRLGDLYSKYKDAIGVLSPEYFINAIQEMNLLRKQSDFKDIKIVTDSPDVASKLCKNFPIDFEFIDTENVHPGEVLMYISKHKFIVTGNSSFSLWAAALSGESTQVIIPQPLNRSGANIQGIPTNWTRFDAIFI